MLKTSSEMLNWRHERRRFQAGLLQCAVEWCTGGDFWPTTARPEQPGQSRLPEPWSHRRQAAASLAIHWLPVRQRVTYKLAVLTHKVRTTATPTYLRLGLFDMSLKNLGFLKKNLKNLKSPNLGFLGF